MMKFETKNGRDWQGFSKILEVMSFVDDIEGAGPDESRKAAEKLCELPANPGQTMSMEEVVFWAGVATGIEAWRNAEEGNLDAASIFAHSTRNAIVDLALGQIDAQPEEQCQNSGRG